MSNLIEAQVCLGEGSTSCQPPMSFGASISKRRSSEHGPRNISFWSTSPQSLALDRPVSVRKGSLPRERDSVPVLLATVKCFVSGRNVVQKIPRRPKTGGIGTIPLCVPPVANLRASDDLVGVATGRIRAETNQPPGRRPPTPFTFCGKSRRVAASFPRDVRGRQAHRGLVSICAGNGAVWEARPLDLRSFSPAAFGLPFETCV